MLTHAFSKPLTLANGSLEALKWLALVAMTYDHVERLLLVPSGVGPATAFGRLAFPLFAFVLAHNLARPGIGPAVYRRLLFRLSGFGLLAVPSYQYFLGPLPLNILFTLALATLLIWCFESRTTWVGRIGFLGLLPASLLVEYSWYGIVLVLGLYCWCRFGLLWWTLAGLVLGFWALTLANGTAWGCWAIFLIIGASYLTLSVPRLKWIFYVYYPFHLSLLVLLRWWWGGEA